MNTITQNTRLKTAFENGAKLTPLDALEILGIYRFSARIYDLKQQGYKLASEWVTVKNKYGEKIKVKRFWKSKSDKQ